MMYYHITKPENANKIFRVGINCNEEGDIFLFENVWISKKGGVARVNVSDMIAANQIGLKSYEMFEIDPAGFNRDLIPDNCGEYTAGWQWILNKKG